MPAVVTFAPTAVLYGHASEQTGGGSRGRRARAVNRALAQSAGTGAAMRCRGRAICTLDRGSTPAVGVARVQASLVIRTGGDWHAFKQRLALAETDWREALVGAGLGDEDWPHRLDAILGTN